MLHLLQKGYPSRPCWTGSDRNWQDRSILHPPAGAPKAYSVLRKHHPDGVGKATRSNADSLLRTYIVYIHTDETVFGWPSQSLVRLTIGPGGQLEGCREERSAV